MGRRRFFAYLGVILIVFWTVGTYYLAVYRTPHADQQMSVVKKRTSDLKEKLSRVEDAIEKQAKENKKLLAALLSRLRQSEQSSTDPRKEIKPGLSSPVASVMGTVELDSPIAILVFACNRPEAIKNHLSQLIKLRPSKKSFPIIVSQDCNAHEATANAVRSFGDNVTLIQHPDQTDITLPPKMKKFLGYYKISRHYRWALNQTFINMGHKALIVTEDDLDVSVDFFEYFIATYPLLRLDPSLWCVSAWNDNGKEDKIEKKPDLLFRTDFFPGLGWMLTREVWLELNGKWPPAFWDDWMRKTEQRKERACIRPEISRTAMSKHGKVGVSRGLFFDKHLKHIVLSREKVEFTKRDLSYLLKENYDQAFVHLVYSSPSITQPELHNGKLDNGQPLPASVRLTYDNKNTYKTTAKAFGLMDDFRAGVPRTAYRGVVPFMYGKTRVFLAPMPDWKGYDESWS